MKKRSDEFNLFFSIFIYIFRLLFLLAVFETITLSAPFFFLLAFFVVLAGSVEGLVDDLASLPFSTLSWGEGGSRHASRYMALFGSASSVFQVNAPNII